MGVSSAVKTLEGGPAHRLRQADDPARVLAEADRGTRSASCPGSDRRRRSSRRRRTTPCAPTFEPAGVEQPRGAAVARHVQHLGRRGRDPGAVDAGERVRQAGARQLGLANANVQGHGAVRHHQDRVADRGRGEDRRRPPADRVGDLQPAAHGTCRSRSTRRSSTRAAIPTNRTLSDKDKLIDSPVQHLRAHRAAADADRGRERGVAEGGARTRADRRTCTTSSIDKTGDTRSRRRSRSRTRTSRSRKRERRCFDRRRSPARRGSPGVIGDPVRHSLSPVLHNAAYARARARLGVRRVRGARRASAAAALDAMRVLGLVGLSVTMPHKTDGRRRVRRALRRTRPRSRSVNTVSRRRRRPARRRLHRRRGLPARRSRERGHDPAGAARRSCSARGRGAAGRAGARRGRRARSPCAPAGPTRPRSRPRSRAAPTVPWDRARPRWRDARLVVNATPIGMGPATARPTSSRLPLGVLAARSSSPTSCTTRSRRRCCAAPAAPGAAGGRRPRDARAPGRAAGRAWTGRARAGRRDAGRRRARAGPVDGLIPTAAREPTAERAQAAWPSRSMARRRT